MKFYVKAYEEFGDRIGIERMSRNMSKFHTTVDCLVIVDQATIEVQPLFKPIGMPYVFFAQYVRINKGLLMYRCVNGEPVF